MNRTESRKLQVGFKDAASFGLGVSVPFLLLLSTLILAIAISLGRDAGPALSAAFSIGLVLTIALEMLRRYVLATRPAGGRKAVRILRGVIWLVVLGSIPVTAFVAIGVVTKCYGQSCGILPEILLKYMLGWLVLCLIGVPFGYRLLSRATWLQPR